MMHALDAALRSIVLSHMSVFVTNKRTVALPLPALFPVESTVKANERTNLQFSMGLDF